MKRLIALLLCIITVLGLCACGDTAEETPAVLEIGYGRADIMPKEPVPLGGYGHSERRITSNFLDILYSTCIAFRYGEEIVLWFTQDLCGADWGSYVRPLVSNETGIPVDRIMLCTTHTHSAPDTSSSDPSIGSYKALYAQQTIKSAKEAIADLTPGKLYGTKTVADLNFIRHYELLDGTFGGDNFGDFSVGIKDHAAENDPEMLLVKIDREGDKKDILLMNWQAHPCKTGGGTKTDISADFIGGTRQAVETETGMLFAYFTGAAGNHNTSSRITGEEKTMDHWEFGKEMCRIATEALPNLQPIEGEGIQVVKLDHEAQVNHDDEHLSAEARQVIDLWNSNGGDTAAANVLARQLGISSVFHANAILARPSRPATSNMELYALRIGGFAFTITPNELFAATGSYIKENSPFDMTFICTCSNASTGYLPTADAYDYGCYESYTSIYAKGTAETLQVKYVEMLEEMK